MSDDISTEAERVKFLQTAAQIMLAKARMKLNLKRLYAADGTAVRELLKLAELLHRATQTASSTDEVCQCTMPQRTIGPHAVAALEHYTALVEGLSSCHRRQ
jgi:hypothetical protein